MTADDSTLASVFSYANFVYALAGAAGSVIAMIVFYPLDTVRSILQIEDKRESHNSLRMIRDIVQEEGVQRLYRGLRPVLITICVSNFIYFYTYHGLKSLWRQFFGSSNPGSRDLITALIAGSVNVLMTTPLWVVVTRLKFQGSNIRATWYDPKLHQGRYKSLLDGLIQIARVEGIGSLWNGTVPSLLLVFNPGIQFMVYEIQKRYAQHVFATLDLSGIVYFLMGAVSKTVATLITYPLQVIQSRLRYKDKKTEATSSVILRLIRPLMQIVANQGFKGLYKGLEAKLSQTILTAALMFLCYEKISAFVFWFMGMNVKNVTSS